MNKSHIFQAGSLIPVSFTCWETQQVPQDTVCFLPLPLSPFTYSLS